MSHDHLRGAGRYLDEYSSRTSRRKSGRKGEARVIVSKIETTAARITESRFEDLRESFLQE